jgi:hypothetical protein
MGTEAPIARPGMTNPSSPNHAMTWTSARSARCEAIVRCAPRPIVGMIGGTNDVRRPLSVEFRIDHDLLMGRLAQRVTDSRVLKLVRAFLNAGVLENGLVSATEEGTPQGGPICG